MAKKEIIQPVRESPLKRISRALLPVALILGGLYLFQPHISAITASTLTETFKGIGLSWRNFLKPGETRSGIAMGLITNESGRIVRVGATGL